MTAPVNRVHQAIKEGRTSFGIYVGSPSTKLVEMLGFSGLDFIRISMGEYAVDMESTCDLIRTAHAVGITPFVKVALGNEQQIEVALGAGAMGIIVSRCSGPEDVEAAVRAAKPPPLGERHATPGGFTGGYGQLSYDDHLQWTNDNIILAFQVETKRGVEAIDEILAVPGLDMVHSGRGDLSYQYGVPGQQYHPLVMAAERRVIEAGLKAGKITTVQQYPLQDPKFFGVIRDWIKQGVQCVAVGSDRDLVSVYRQLMTNLRSL